MKKGIVNLEKHIENLQKFGVPVVVTLNSFVTDTKAETRLRGAVLQRTRM